MIYASSSVIVNVSRKDLWAVMVDASPHPDKYSDDFIALDIKEKYYDGLLREYEMDSYLLTERVHHLKERRKIVWHLNEHPIYFGETILHILCPDDDQLSDKKVTLNTILTWRIHPGVIATPYLDKQEYLDQLTQNIAHHAESGANLNLI